MLLSQIAAACAGLLLGADREASVESSVDSREVVPGGLFFALPGEQTDGHQFVPQALAAGAAAAVVNREIPGVGPQIVVTDVRAALGQLASAHVAALRAAGNLTVLAVTGSAGKTTTKDLLQAALPDAVATRRSLNNEIGLPLTALRAGPDTHHLVLEMGADHEGDLTYLTGLAPPDIAIVLLVGRAHLGMFGGTEGVYNAKRELVAGLLPSGVAVLNADDPLVARMAELAPGRVLWFGLGEGADVRGSDVSLDDSDRATFTATYGGASVRVPLGLAGAHHVSNALAALAGAVAAGVTLEDAAGRIAGLAPASAHRMALATRDGVLVVDDAYNANPDSMAAALQAVARIAGGRRTLAVLGEMRELGPAAPAEHAAVGVLAAELGYAHVVVVGAEAEGIAAAMPPGRTTLVADNAQAAATLGGLVRPGDVVLFKASNGTGLWRLAEEWTP